MTVTVTTLPSRTWQEHVALAEHHLAIGQTTISLYDPSDDIDQDYPWPWVNEVMVNSDGDSVRFLAAHPSGLTFLWWADGLLVRDANRCRTGAFDLPAYRRLLERLPSIPRTVLLAQLAQVADAAAADARRQIEQEQRRIEEADLLLKLTDRLRGT